MRIVGLGQVLFALAGAGLAVLSLAYGGFAPIWQPLPGWIPWREIWAYGCGLFVLAASVGLCFSRTALPSALTIGTYLAGWVATCIAPVVVKPLSVGSCYGFFEALAPLVGAWILYEMLRPQSPDSATRSIAGERAVRAAGILFGATCVVFGLAHFAYAEYTAGMVPTWLPGRLGFAYFTGIAHIAAGSGIIFGMLPRLAATLEAIMMSMFGLLVWVPSLLVRTPPAWTVSARNQWSELVVTLLLAATAWIVANSLRNRSWGFAAR